MRFIESDENLALRGAALEEAIKDDIKLGLIPFWVRLRIIAIAVDKSPHLILFLKPTINVVAMSEKQKKKTKDKKK